MILNLFLGILLGGFDELDTADLGKDIEIQEEEGLPELENDRETSKTQLSQKSRTLKDD